MAEKMRGKKEQVKVELSYARVAESRKARSMELKMGNGDSCSGNMFDPAMYPITLTERIIR